MDDSASFERMYRRWWPEVCAAAFVVLENGADAEDVAQVVFSRLWKKGTWRSVRRPEAYFREAGRREALGLLRRRKGHAPTIDLSSRVAAVLRSPDAASDVRLIRADREGLAATLVSRLPPRCRAAATLVYLEGLTHQEAAKRLGISVKAVRKQFARARIRLREIVRDGVSSFSDGGG